MTCISVCSVIKNAARGAGGAKTEEEALNDGRLQRREASKQEKRRLTKNDKGDGLLIAVGGAAADADARVHELRCSEESKEMQLLTA